MFGTEAYGVRAAAPLRVFRGVLLQRHDPAPDFTHARAQDQQCFAIKGRSASRPPRPLTRERPRWQSAVGSARRRFVERAPASCPRQAIVTHRARPKSFHHMMSWHESVSVPALHSPSGAAQTRHRFFGVGSALYSTRARRLTARQSAPEFRKTLSDARQRGTPFAHACPAIVSAPMIPASPPSPTGTMIRSRSACVSAAPR